MFGKIDFLMVIKLLFKLLIMTLVILVVGVFLWRFSISRIPDELMELTPNATLSEAYAQNPDLTLFTQEQNTTTRGENSYGYFTVCDAVFIPEAGQVQILIRYNDSTLRATEEDYGLAEDSLDPEKDWYDISLLVSLDKTLGDTNDNLGNNPESVEFVRIAPAEVSAAVHEGLHSYRRLIFNDVPFGDNVLAVYADFYFKDDIRYQQQEFDIYSEVAYGTLCLYAYTEPTVSRALTESEAESLESISDPKN